MNERITNNIDPTEEEIIEWGYDENLFFTEQDEDLLLYDVRHVPAVLSLLADPACPKRTYVQTILNQFTMGSATTRNRSTLDELFRIAGTVPDDAEVDVVTWRDLVRRLMASTRPPVPVDADTAYRMASAFFFGCEPSAVKSVTKGTLECTEEAGCWRCVARDESGTRYLFIETATGYYEYEALLY